MEENKAIVQRLLEEVFNQHNLAVIDELVSPDYQYHDLDPGHSLHGPAAYRRLAASILAAFPDLHLTIEDLIAEGDRVVARWSARGTHRGPLLGIAPTGREVAYTGIGIRRIANGKITEHWENLDTLGLLQQLGAIPSETHTTW